MHVHHALQKKWNKMDTSSVDGGVINHVPFRYQWDSRESRWAPLKSHGLKPDYLVAYFTRDNSSLSDTPRLHSCVITCRDFVREMSEDSDDTRCHCRFGCGLQLKQVPIYWRLVLANMMNCGVRSCYSISSIISTNHKIIRVTLFVYIYTHRYKYKYKYEYKYKYTIYIIYI
jgi:hypothetical protein